MTAEYIGVDSYDEEEQTCDHDWQPVGNGPVLTSTGAPMQCRIYQCTVCEDLLYKFEPECTLH